MKQQLFIKTDAGITRLCRFLASFNLPKPIVVQGRRGRVAMLYAIHLQQLRALSIGWRNLREAKRAVA